MLVAAVRGPSFTLYELTPSGLLREKGFARQECRRARAEPSAAADGDPLVRYTRRRSGPSHRRGNARRQSKGELVRDVVIQPRWHTVAEVAVMLGYGESKVRMLIIQGDIKSLKDGRSRRILPQWVDEFVERRAAEAAAEWLG